MLHTPKFELPVAACDMVLIESTGLWRLDVSVKASTEKDKASAEVSRVAALDGGRRAPFHAQLSSVWREAAAIF